MRLCIVTHNVIRTDGQGRVNLEIARYALAQGIRIWLIADTVDPDLIAMGAQWLPAKPHFGRVNLFKVARFVSIADKQLQALGNDIDIIHANGNVLNRPHHINTAHFVHGAWLRSPVHTARLRHDWYGAYQWFYTYCNARWERRAYRQARLVVAVSQKVRGELVQIGVPAERIRVILNGVDPHEFRPGPADRRALGLAEGVPLALFAGDIRTPLKNLDTVLHALQQVPDLHLAVAGATAGSAFPQLAASLGLAGRVTFLGFRADMPELMRAVDLFVFPSRFDSCPLVLLEAMASGLPIVTASTVGASELVSSGCGIVVPEPDDRAALAQALRKLAGDAAERGKMGAAARAIAERHGWQAMARSYVQLYQELAG